MTHLMPLLYQFDQCTIFGDNLFESILLFGLFMLDNSEVTVGFGSVASDVFVRLFDTGLI